MHITLEQYRALVEAGIIGKVEYLDRRMVMEGLPMRLSPVKDRENSAGVITRIPHL